MRNRPLPADQTQRDPASLRGGSLGTWLRQQREARGISLVEVGGRSKISRRYLEALEADRWDLLPAPVFTKGFLREYARIVGLDEDEVINLYLLATQAESGKGAPSSRPRDGVEEAPQGLLERLGYVWVLLAAFAVFVGLVVWLGHRSEAPTPNPLHLPDPGPPPLSPPAGEKSNSGEAEEAGSVASETASVPQLHVQLVFRGDCWVEAVVDGKRRLSELKIAGETLEFVANQRVELTLGNRDAAQLFVNGKAQELPPAPSRVLRGLVLEVSNGPSALPNS